MNPQKEHSLIDADDMRIIGKFISKNWLLIVTLPAVAAIVSYIYTYRLPDVYAAKTEIIIKSQESSMVESNLVGATNPYARIYQQYGNMQDQKRVIKSFDLVAKAVSKLDLGVSYYIVGRLKTTEQFQNPSFTIDVKSVNSFLYEKPIDFKIINENEYSLSYIKEDEKITVVHDFNEEVSTLDYNIIANADLTSRELSTLADIEYQVIFHSTGSLVSKFVSSMELEDEAYTSILRIQVTDYIPARAKLFLDTLSNIYIDYTLQKEVSINENTLHYIHKQLEEVTYILDSLELSLEKYKANQAILNISREEEEYFNQLTEFEKERRLLELRLESIFSLREYIITNNEDEPLVPPSLYMLDDDFLKSSINELYGMQIGRSEELFGKTENSQAILMGDKKMEDLRSTILIYLDKTQKAIYNKMDDLTNQINQIKELIRDVPKTQRDLLNIERRIHVNEKMYLFLLEKRAATVIARASILPESSILEKARPLGVVGPNKTRTIIMATGAGFLLAVLIGFIRFVFFNRIESTRELKGITQLPVITGIPTFEDETDGKIEVMAQPKSAVAEAFRSVRANLPYFSKNKDFKTILVTSLHPGEGKTFVASNLAVILANAGKRVLLLDFDLHKPKVHKRFKLENNKGASGYLSGQQSTAEIIHKNVVHNLDIITGGPIPPNASEIILSEKTTVLIEEARANYDYVIIDTPPLMLISDSQVLVNHSEMALFVLNSKKAHRDGVKYLEEFSEKLDNTSIGLILNNIQVKKWRYYYGKVTGNYGYGYGEFMYQYGNANKKK
jgi:capsular exopolysaccharide synthesis family protein